jgi:hypothetical protein
METVGRGLFAGAWGLVPSALKIAPCAGQLNCPVDALYLTATPACVQACSTATKLPLLIWTSQLACLSAGLMKLTALFVARLVEPITVPVGIVGVGVCVGDDVGDGCGVCVCVGEAVGCAPGDPEGVGFLCGHFPSPSPSPSLSLPPTLSLPLSFTEVVEVEPVFEPWPSSISNGDGFVLSGDRARLIPPIVTTVITPAVPAASSVRSFLRPNCAGAGSPGESGSDFARRTGGRWADVLGVWGEVRGLPDVAAHRVNGSTPPIASGSPSAGARNAASVGSISVGASGDLESPGSFIEPLPASSPDVTGDWSPLNDCNCRSPFSVHPFLLIC